MIPSDLMQTLSRIVEKTVESSDVENEEIDVLSKETINRLEKMGYIFEQEGE